MEALVGWGILILFAAIFISFKFVGGPIALRVVKLPEPASRAETELFEKIRSTIYWRSVAIAILLLAWIDGWPSEFYTVLRLTIFCIALSCYFASKKLVRNEVSYWTHMIITVLYNPFVKFPLGRSNWLLVDAIVILIYTASIVGLIRSYKTGQLILLPESDEIDADSSA